MTEGERWRWKERTEASEEILNDTNMEVNHPGINQQARAQVPRPSNSSCFAEQTHRVEVMSSGYTGSGIGQTPRAVFQNHHLPHHLCPYPHPYPQPQPRPHLFHHPGDMHEAIRREIEKERIREEIIVYEARRRILEAEVRRELMMERELALQRGGGGLPFASSSHQSEFDSAMRLSLLGTRAKGRSLEERIAMANVMNGRREIGGFDTVPFHRGTTDVKISEVKPVPEVSKEQQKVILLAKPDKNTSGTKRKANEVAASQLLPSSGISNKKAKCEWSCALCHVSATSEQALKDHLQGKKHKSKEAAIRAQKAGTNYTIEFLSKKAIQIIETVDPVPGQVPPLQANESESVIGQRKPPKTDDEKKNRFWCEICRVGTHTRKVLTAHQKGKKHVNRLRARDRKSGKIVVEDEISTATDQILDKLADKKEDHGAENIIEPENNKKEYHGVEDITGLDKDVVV